MVIYEWWAAAINLLLVVLLGLSARWWLRPARLALGRLAPRANDPAMVLAVGDRRHGADRFSGEFSAFRRASGMMRIPVCTVRFLVNTDTTRTENFKLKEATWEIALWNYWKPANHQLQTILSKACLETWRALTRPVGLQFSEPIVRFPCLVAGILSVGALALLLKRLGFARAGVIAAFVLSVHPWHVRYAIELRGYIFTLLFGPLMIYCLIQAIESGRWRWWTGFAASEFALLYAYPGCLYMVAIANFCGAISLFQRHSTGEARWQHFSRFLVATTVAGMIYLQLMLPCVPQLINYFETERALGELGLRWHKNMGAHLLAGIPWNNSDIRSAGYQELQWAAEARPYMFLSLRSAALGFFVLGVLRLGLSRPAGWLVLSVLLIPGVLVYIISRSKNHYLYEWYLLFTLSGFVGLAALGLDWLAGITSRAHRMAPSRPGGPRGCQLLCRDTAAASLACYTSSPAHEGSCFAYPSKP